MNTDKQKEKRPIKCRCGKVVAVEHQGKIYIFCKNCKRQIPIEYIK